MKFVQIFLSGKSIELWPFPMNMVVMALPKATWLASVTMISNPLIPKAYFFVCGFIHIFPVRKGPLHHKLAIMVLILKYDINKDVVLYMYQGPDKQCFSKCKMVTIFLSICLTLGLQVSSVVNLCKQF